jgi:hypothetical protein
MFQKLFDLNVFIFNYSFNNNLIIILIVLNLILCNTPNSWKKGKGVEEEDLI